MAKSSFYYIYNLSTPSLFIFYLILLSTTFTKGFNSNYDGDYGAMKVSPKSFSELLTFKELLKNNPQVKVWQEQNSLQKRYTVVAPSSSYTRLKKNLNSHHIYFEVIVPEIIKSINDMRKIDAETEKSENWWKTYHDYIEIKNWLDNISKKCTENCELIEIGRSYEGKPLNIMKIGIPGKNKPSIWIDAGLHAREWISPAVALYIIEKLIAEQYSNKIVAELLSSYDWYIHPLVNPDGYNYTWHVDRNWRKTRSINFNSTCIGTDPNRNFDHQWMLMASSDPCSNTYAGATPFSEPESRSLANFIRNNSINWQVYLSLHSYGQLMMTPYGHTKSKPSNFNDMMEAGIAALEALESVHGTKYTLGSAADILYQSSGTSRDWARGAAKMPYVYTLELRDTGHYGFLLPQDQIIPTGEETWAAIEALVTYIKKKENL